METLKAALTYYVDLVDGLTAKWADPNVMLLLYRREILADRVVDLSLDDLRRLEHADAALARKWKIVSDFVPHPAHTDRSRWWWFLHEGPQVREAALKEQA